MKPIGGGTSSGTEDMLSTAPASAAAATAERALYDNALLTLQPFISLAITIDLPTLNRIIAMMEGEMSFFQKAWLKAKYMAR